MTTARLRWIWLLVALAVALAIATVLVVNRPPRHQEVVLPWLLCDECIDGERAAVLELGPDVVPALALALEGPSPELVRAAERRFERHWERTARFLLGRGETAPIPRDQFVSANLSNFEASYRRRAAIGLAAVGGDPARETLSRFLDRVAADSLRADVRLEIEGALARIGEP